MRTLVILAMVATMFACKPGDKVNDGSQPTTPKRVGDSGDAAAAAKVGVLGAGGGKSLYMDLQRPPEAREAARLWACWNLPADDFALGRAVCKSDASKSIEVTAANVDFICTGNPDFGTVKAKRAISLDFCATYDVFAYRFEPAFNLKIQE